MANYFAKDGNFTRADELSKTIITQYPTSVFALSALSRMASHLSSSEKIHIFDEAATKYPDTFFGKTAHQSSNELKEK